MKKYLLLIGILACSALYSQALNLNIDWKFTKPKSEVYPMDKAMKTVEKNGKPFYAIDYDDADWERISLPHTVNDEDSFDELIGAGEKTLYNGMIFYRKHFTLSPESQGRKVFLEFEAARQAVYLYVNGKFVGYYEAGIASCGFDLTSLTKPGDNLIAVAVDGTSTSRETLVAIQETIPGNTPGDLSGVKYQWSGKGFNPLFGGLNGNVNLYIKEPAYLTLPLYNNLKTTGTYIYASDFDLAKRSARINVRAEVRNETGKELELGVGVRVLNTATGKQVASFQSDKKISVAPAKDAGKTYAVALENDVYQENPKPTSVITPEVQYITVNEVVTGLDFWSSENPALYQVVVSLNDSTGKSWDSQTITTGFREVKFDAAKGLLINGKSTYLRGYAQRSSNEWAVIGMGNDWLNDFDMELVRESGADFIRWMHNAPKPSTIRSGDKYGVVSIAPAGDSESDKTGRQWNLRVEAMRDTILYFRNSPSILFWEAGNNAITGEHMKEMYELKQQLDPNGGRMMGCRTISKPDQIKWAEWVGTMIYRHDAAAKASMNELNRQLPMYDTEYKRDEAPRRVWDRYSPPDYDYVNKWLGKGSGKMEGCDVWNLTQEDFIRSTASVNDGYGYFYGNRVGGPGHNYYGGAAMMIWADSNQHGRNSGSENARVSGRVDAVRIPKESFYALQVFQAQEPKIKIIGHWNYPKLTPETYLYRERKFNGKFWEFTDEVKQRDPKNKTVYVVGSLHCAKIELSVNGKKIGENSNPEDLFIYAFPGIDVTQSGEISAIAKNARGEIIAQDKIKTVGEAAAIRLTPVTGPAGFRADGSDLMFFDVAIVDDKGRVCPLAYDRIDFKLEGPGIFLGGYNSGKYGENSVIHKNHAFAECGLNRVFVRSTFAVGELTLTATSGKFKTSASLKSVPVEVKDGFATTQQSFPAGLKKYPVSEKYPAVRDLGFVSGNIDRYKITVNGKALKFAEMLTPYKPDDGTGVVGPIVPVLKAVNKAGADLKITNRTTGRLPEYMDEYSTPYLILEAGGKKIEMANGATEMFVDKTDRNLTNFQFISQSNVLIGELSAVLAYIPGVEVKVDTETKTMNITVNK